MMVMRICASWDIYSGRWWNVLVLLVEAEGVEQYPDDPVVYDSI